MAVGLVAGLAWAQAATAGGVPHGGVSLSPWTLEGRVVSVDAHRGTLVIDASGRTTTLAVAPRATVVRDGWNVPFAEVQPGDDVRAFFLAEDLARERPWKLEFRSRPLDPQGEPGGRTAPEPP
jgi:hypothetical protein